MLIPEALLDRVNVEDVVRSEIGTPPDKIPTRTVENALGDDLAAFVPEARGLLRANSKPYEVERLFANKDSTSYRPIRRLSLQSRLQLRALASLVQGELVPPVNRSYPAYAQFQTEVLEEPATRYVVACDVHGFYQYVRHQNVHDEIVGLTGAVDLATALSDFLSGLMGGPAGLPQLYDAADPLAEIVIDAATRRLTRAGLQIARFNDDFRIGCRSYAEALAAAIKVTGELEHFGLTLNERKTLIFQKDRYQGWIRAPRERWAELVGANAETRLLAFDSGYQEVWVEVQLPPSTASRAAAGGAALKLWNEFQTSKGSDNADEWMFVKLAGLGLRELAASPSVVEPDMISKLARREPQLTPDVARYLAALAPFEPGFVADVLSSLTSSSGAGTSAWRSAWLLVPILSLSSPPASLQDWVEACFRSRSDTLAGLAAAACALHGWVTLEDVTRRFDHSGPAAKPEFAAAAAFLASKNTNALKSIRGEGDVYARIADKNFDSLSIV
ncbi:MAG: hypothetical protein H6512_11890 [Acidimicrobiia bacterium]|nr:hypothetical protein [Acidimicrobiia bacterium]